MSLDVTRDLSVPDLLHILNKKLGLDCATLRKTCYPLAVSTTPLELEVSVS